MRTVILVALVAAGGLAQDLSIIGPTPATIRLGERATVTLTVAAPPTALSLGLLPSVKGLRIIPGQPRFKNGATHWDLTLRPLDAGRFTVPSFAVNHDGRELRSGPLTITATRDGTGAPHAFLELNTSRATVYIGERVTISLSVGLEEAFLNENLVPLFRQPLDLPVQIEALGELSGASLAALPGAATTVAVNGGRAVARRDQAVTREGRQWIPFELEWTFTPTADTGPRLTLAAPLVRFAFATRFEDDFINGRVAIDRREAFAYGDGLTLEIAPLPERDDPSVVPIGEFSSSAALDGTDQLDPDEPLEVLVTVSGTGTLDLVPTPSVPPSSGLHVRGVKRALDRDGVRFVVELVRVEGSPPALPAFGFEAFDPKAARYVRVASAPIPITWAGAVTGQRSDVAVLRNRRLSEFPIDAPRRLAPALLIAGLLVPLLGFAGLRWWTRSRERDRLAPERARARDAYTHFQAALKDDRPDLAEALTEYVSARLRCQRAAVMGADARPRLRNAGVEEALAERTHDVLRRLLSSGYGGASHGLNSEAIARIARELEDAFTKGAPQ